MNRFAFETALLRVLRPLVLVALAVICIFPFLYMVLLSFVPVGDLLANPGRLIPDASRLTLDTYREVLASVDDGGQGFGVFLRNSFLVSAAAVVLSLLAAIPGAYAVSRLAFAGRRQVSALFLAVYLFPPIVLAIPLVIGFSKIGLAGSLVGLMLVYVVQTVPVSIHMLRNYLETVPESLEEAAKLDGAGRLRTLRSVILPLAMPTIMSTALYVFMIAWNEFLFALLFLAAQPERWTVSLGLSQLANGLEISKTVLMAGSVVLTVPVVILYAIAERSLTEGLTGGAEKG